MRTLIGALRARRPTHASGGGRDARVSPIAGYRQDCSATSATQR
jgi:hypothetical protein